MAGPIHRLDTDCRKWRHESRVDLPCELINEYASSALRSLPAARIGDSTE
jgi:hypothetical protein